MNRILASLALTLTAITTASSAGPLPQDNFAGPEALVIKSHAASLSQREQRLRQTIANDTTWPNGIWGDNLWTLAALRLNEKTGQANARLLHHASQFLAIQRAGGQLASPTPEQPDGAPWTFFSITDYVRTLCLFHSQSPHFPGRLTPATEAAMKEALWLWTSASSRLADYGADDLFLLLGTENHDLNIRPVHHLVTSLLANHLEVTRYDASNPQSFTLPSVNGEALDLHPRAVYESPFLNGEFGGDQFTITVGPLLETLNFNAKPAATPK
jgi:hypothetical protein